MWEDEIGKVKQGGSYRMSRMMVREFEDASSCLQLRRSSKIETIADFGDGEEGSIDDEREYQSNQPLKLSNAHVVGVHYNDQYTSCLKYTVKVFPDKDPELGMLGNKNLDKC